MALRIGRGLFRLWLLLSVLWIGGVTVETWRIFPADIEVSPTRPAECTGKTNDECADILKRLGKNPFDAFDPNPPPPGFVVDPKPTFDPSEYAAFKACIDAGKSADQCAAQLKVPPFDPSKPYQIVRDDERRTAVRFAAMLALAPSILILALGSALGWAFSGFRSDDGAPRAH